VGAPISTTKLKPRRSKPWGGHLTAGKLSRVRMPRHVANVQLHVTEWNRRPADKNFSGPGVQIVNLRHTSPREQRDGRNSAAVYRLLGRRWRRVSGRSHGRGRGEFHSAAMVKMGPRR
jgi:hypothetical protein